MTVPLPAPYGQVTTHAVVVSYYSFFRHPELPYLDTAKECLSVYTADQMHAHAAAVSAAENAGLQKDYFGAAIAVGTAAQEIAALREAMALAYGHLWCINDEPGTPSRMYAPMEAAYQARQILRELLTGEQRGNGIDAARAALGSQP